MSAPERAAQPTRCTGHRRERSSTGPARGSNRMSWPQLSLGCLIIALGVYGVYFWRQWLAARRAAKTLARLVPALVEFPEFSALLEHSKDRSHFIERHGPMLERLDVQQRALTGSMSVAGVAGKPVTSARWLSHAYLLRAIELALEQWSESGCPRHGSFNLTFDYPVGEGYEKGKTNLRPTNCARVIIRDGAVVTAYPELEPNTSLERK